MILGIKNTIIAIIVTASLGWGYSQYQFKEGIKLGKQQQIALQSEADNKLTQVKEDLETLLVKRLNNIQLKNTTIHNQAIKEIFTKEVYKDCVLPQEGKVEANEALERSGDGK